MDHNALIREIVVGACIPSAPNENRGDGAFWEFISWYAIVVEPFWDVQHAWGTMHDSPKP